MNEYKVFMMLTPDATGFFTQLHHLILQPFPYRVRADCSSKNVSLCLIYRPFFETLRILRRISLKKLSDFSFLKIKRMRGGMAF